jgi:hypothetical protein
MIKTITLILFKNILTVYIIVTGYLYFTEYQHITFYFTLAMLGLASIQVDLDRTKRNLAVDFVKKLLNGRDA